ncbi:MAG TPA: helix-turn-helix domain-containing protein, partial [Candidatus Cloacimonadota bacterium]|nr:helix-turn-helix domain-containing protein [Candidatus Cloacimonadota bacterium]
NAGSLHIPALKDRKEDITPLAQMFLRNYSDVKKRRFKLISKAAMTLLESYDWPGNVRELQNTIERATVLYDDIELKAVHIDFLGEIGDEYAAFNKNQNPNSMLIDLPEDGISLEEIEQEIIKHLLKKFDGNKSKVSEYLNISRNTIRRKLNEV